jgi:hypothetical protein
MKNEAIIILSFIYKRSGKSELSASEIFLTLSMDLNWFNLNTSKLFLNYSMKEGLLKKHNNNLITTFDFKKIKIPAGYQPTKDISFGESTTKCSSLNLLDELICKIENKTGYETKEIFEKISQISSEKHLSFEIASLLIFIEFDINYDDYIEKIENKIFNKA